MFHAYVNNSQTEISIATISESAFSKYRVLCNKSSTRSELGGSSPRAQPHVHSSPPTVTMPADLVDKIYIGYNAPYALGNMLAPQCVPAPIVSARNIRTTIGRMR